MQISVYSQSIVDDIRAKAYAMDPNNFGLIITPPIVMSSAAGWYIGQICFEPGTRCAHPYDRLTDYMSESDAIASHIDAYTGTETLDLFVE